MKIVEFFSMLWGKLSELEPEPEILTSWIRTKMDRLRNTAKLLRKVDELIIREEVDLGNSECNYVITFI
jgi:hypothetical protein